MELRDADGAAAHRSVALSMLLDRKRQWPKETIDVCVVGPLCHKWSFAF
jgi:hypothetical protein